MSGENELLEQLRRAIDELAEADAGDVVAEARTEARLKVRSMLAEAMAERLLERAHASIAGDPRSEPSPPADATGSGASASASASASQSRARPPRERKPGTLGWYVYGVVGDVQRELPDTPGIDAVHPLAVIAEAGLGAVASQVPLSEFGEESLRDHVEDLDWLEQHARVHEAILESLREGGTLVPMRLCTIYRSAEAVREMLLREQRFLADALTRIAGRTEWGVKIIARPGALERALDEDGAGQLADEGAEAGPGESYMLGRRRQQVRRAESSRLLEERCGAIHAQLGAVAVEARLNPLQPRELTNHEGEMLLNGVYLVDDAAGERFTALAAQLRAEHDEEGLDVELTGPWPPYNFVNSSREVGR